MLCLQGIFVNFARSKSKKAIKTAVNENPESVRIEATSLFGDEYDGPVSGMPDGATVYFVGPDPSRNRKYYGSITRKGDKFTVK